MPHKIDKVSLPDKLDRRRKLTDEDRSEIVALYSLGDVTYQQLAEEYGVSKSLINIVCNPKRAQDVKDRTKANWRKYYDKQGHAEAMKDTRQYKQNLRINGKI